MLRSQLCCTVSCLILVVAAVASDEIAPREIPSRAFNLPGQIPSTVKQGTPPRLNVLELAQATSSEAAEKPDEPSKGSKEGPSFSREIAPIIVGNCLGCHNERAMRKNGKLDLSTFEKLKKGGNSGPVFESGEPDDSHLYLRLTGDETPRMPRGAGDRPLAEASIEKVGAWIKAGAKFDGPSPTALLSTYAATPEQLRIESLAKLSESERDKLVESRGLERWKKGNPKTPAEIETGKSVMLFSLLPKARAEAIVKLMDTQHNTIQSLVAPQAPREPLEKISFYVFNERAHFVEFVRSLEDREVDRDEQRSVALTGEAPYIAVIDPLGGRDEPVSTTKRTSRSRKKARQESMEGPDRSLGGLLTDSLTVGMIERVSKNPPLWLSQGLGAYFGSRIDLQSPHTYQLRRIAFERWQANWTTEANEALGGEGKAEVVEAIGFAMIEALASNRATRPLLPEFVDSLLKDNAKLDDVLKSVLGTDRANFLAGTQQFVGINYGRRR